MKIMDRFNSNEDVEETPLKIAKDIIYSDITLSEKVKIIEAELIKAKSLSRLDVMLSFPSVDKIEEDIKSCYNTEWSGCGQWCGSEDCNGSCSRAFGYEVLNREKLEKVIERWRNKAC